MSALAMVISLASMIVCLICLGYCAGIAARVQATEVRFTEYSSAGGSTTSSSASAGATARPGLRDVNDASVRAEVKGVVEALKANFGADQGARDEAVFDDSDLDGDTEVRGSQNVDYSDDSFDEYAEFEDEDFENDDDEEEEEEEEDEEEMEDFYDEEEERRETEEFYDDESFDVDWSGDMDEPSGRMKRDTGAANRKQKGGKVKKAQKGSKNQRGSRKKSRKVSLPAAQYDGSLEEREIQNITDIYFNSHENRGGSPLNIFKSASWGGDKTSPVRQEWSHFSVKSSGIHLVFAQILFTGNDKVKSASVVQRRGQTKVESLNCHVGAFGAEKRLQTCTIIGFLNLKAKDVIKVESNNRHAPLLRSKGETYFGVLRVTNERGQKKN